MYAIIKDLVQPFPLLLLWVITAFLLVLRQPAARRRWRYVWIPIALLYLTSTPLFAFLSAATLEWQYPPDLQVPEDTEMIVVLSGYYYPVDVERKNYELAEDTLYRCLKAAELYHQGKPRPVLVSGGAFWKDAGGPACAEVMKSFLMRNGVKAEDVFVEDQSRSTHENAVDSALILQRMKIKTILLITDAVHLPRAVGCFCKAGLHVIPCGCRRKANSLDWALTMVLPSPHSARDFQDVWYEWLGLSWYWIHGWI